MHTLKKRLLKILPKRVALILSGLKLIIREPKLLLHFKAQYQHSSPPLFLLSFPRGGSSWVGSVLGRAENVRYLREPVTTAFFYRKKQSASVFTQKRCDDWGLYSKLIKDACKTRITLIDKVIPFSAQWTTPKTPKKTIIKEVNVLIVNELSKLDIESIYLVRHPYSVAKSYRALGWSKANQFITRFSELEIQQLIRLSPDLLSKSYFYQIGFLQGYIECLIRDKNIFVVNYEDLVKEPLTLFSSIFERYDLIMGKSVHNYIKDSLSSNKDVAPGKFSLIRNQQKQSVVSVNITELKDFQETLDGYLASCENLQHLSYADNKYVEFIK